MSGVAGGLQLETAREEQRVFSVGETRVKDARVTNLRLITANYSLLLCLYPAPRGWQPWSLADESATTTVI